MFFTTKVSNKFVRERLETRIRNYSLTKQRQLIINLQQNNSDYDHCAQLVSKISKETNPGLKFHSQMSKNALREIELYLKNNTIFSEVNVSVCDIAKKKGKIIQDSLRYEFIIDNILNIKRNPKCDKENSSDSTLLFNYFYAKISEEVSKNNGSVDIKTKIDPVSLELIVRTSLVNEMTESYDDKEGSNYAQDFLIKNLAEAPDHLIKNKGIHDLLTKWLEINTGYESVKYEILSGKSKDDSFIKWIFSTPIFFSQNDNVNYEELINATEIGRSSIPSVKTTDMTPHFVDQIPFMKLCDVQELNHLYGVKDMDFDFKIKFQSVFDYINGRLRTKDQVITGTYEDDRTVSVVVPFEKFPSLREDTIVDKIKLLYEKEGNNRVVATCCYTAGLVIFTFLL